VLARHPLAQTAQLLRLGQLPGVVLPLRSRATNLFLRAHLRFGLRHLRFEATGIETRQ